MLKLPIYLRGSSYYLHTRVNGKQVKRSLGTSDQLTAMIRACQLLNSSRMDNSKLPASLFNIDPDRVRKYEIDLSRGVLKSDGVEDHARMLEALALLKQAPVASSVPTQAPYSPELLPQAKSKTGLKLMDLIDKFFLLKSHSKPATVVAYKNVAKETAHFLGNPFLQDIQLSDITRLQEHLAVKNSARTVDNKMAVLRTLFSFAKTQGYFFSENPAKDRKILSQKDKDKAGFAIFEKEEIKTIFGSEFMDRAKKEDKDYYWSLMLALYSGARIGEITGLTKKQFKTTENGINYITITDSKTKAGIRKIPLSQRLFDSGLQEFIDLKDRIFKYPEKLGKGSGNAVGKKFKRHLEEVGVDREKLVFHSLRKFLNDYLLKAGMPYEPRCQVIGHEIDDTNVSTYSGDFSVDQLADIMQVPIAGLHNLSGLVKTDFS
jgi:integrase